MDISKSITNNFIRYLEHILLTPKVTQGTAFTATSVQKELVKATNVTAVPDFCETFHG